MFRDVLSYVIGGLILAGVTALIVFGKRIVGLPQEMIIVKAALFRLLRSNKLQGTALAKVAVAIKSGCSNGDTEEAVKAVTTDQVRTDEFFKKIAIVHPNNLDDLMKEDE